jgi:hypothetical protein
VNHPSSSVQNSSICRAARPFSFPEIQESTSENASVCLVFFRVFLAIKIATPFLFPQGNFLLFDPKTLLILFALCVVPLRKYYLPGLLVILGLSAYEIFRSWPFTINHSGLEFVIVALLCLDSEKNDEYRFPSCVDMIRILMLSVWFYSGIHKLLQGYYLNGEFFALEVLSNRTTLGMKLRELLQIFGSFENFHALDCCTSSKLLMKDGHTAFFLILSWLTILTELALPFTLLFKRTRAVGFLSIFFFQGTIAYFSGEIDFAFTAFGVLLLFVPRVAWIGYPTLVSIYFLVQAW